MSYMEIAVDVARMIARAHRCKLESLSLDDVDIILQDGVETVVLRASADITPFGDEIPFEMPVAS